MLSQTHATRQVNHYGTFVPVVNQIVLLNTIYISLSIDRRSLVKMMCYVQSKCFNFFCNIVKTVLDLTQYILLRIPFSMLCHNIFISSSI